LAANNKDKAYLVDGKYGIGNLVDLDQLRELFEKFTEATGFTIGFLDHPGMNILISSGWRDICTQFHRGCPISEEICIKSNQRLLGQLDTPGRLVIESCGNGLVDCALPIIIRDKHIASLATGQLLLNAPDIEWFKQHACLCGFDEKEYLEALEEIPVIDENRLKVITGFLGNMAQLISQMGYTRMMAKEDAGRMATEIAERKHSQQALWESEKRFRQIAENALEWIWEVDANGLYTYASPIVEKILGYKPDEIVEKKHFYDLFHPEYRKEVKNAAFEVFAKKLSLREFPNRNVHKTGKDVWLSTSGVPILDEKGELLGYRGADTDITERKRAEDALKESEERYRRLVENTDDLIYRYEFIPKRGFTYVSPSATGLTGYTPEEHYADPDLGFKLIHTEDCHLLERLVQGEGDIRKAIVLRWRKKDRSLIWTEQRNVPIYDDEGNLVAIEGIARDISERKQAEEAVQESEAKYRSLIENSNDAIYLLYNRKFEIINKKFEEILGYTLEEVNKPDFDFISLVAPKSRPIIEERAKRTSKGEKLEPKYEFTAQNKDGEELEVEASVSYINYKDGIATQGIIRDITERKIAEERIQRDLVEKELLLKEIHHRVKNSLQVVASLLQLQSGKVKDAQVIDLFKKSRDRIYMMSSVYEKFYQTKTFVNIDFKEYLEGVLNRL